MVVGSKTRKWLGVMDDTCRSKVKDKPKYIHLQCSIEVQSTVTKLWDVINVTNGIPANMYDFIS